MKFKIIPEGLMCGINDSTMRRINFSENREGLSHGRLRESTCVRDLLLLLLRGHLLRRIVDFTEHLRVLDFISFSESLFLFTKDLSLEHSNRSIGSQ